MVGADKTRGIWYSCAASRNHESCGRSGSEGGVCRCAREPGRSPFVGEYASAPGLNGRPKLMLLRDRGMSSLRSSSPGRSTRVFTDDVRASSSVLAEGERGKSSVTAEEEERDRWWWWWCIAL